MRELRVVGVDADGSQVICQDAQSGEKFAVPADEKLRAAARGDLSRLGQIEIEMTSALRPREIQSRIRAGATVAEVAAIAGVGVDKIERFAHPVLLERARAAELAALAHPIRHDGPSVATLGEVTTEGLAAFGQNPADAQWDAWKAEDGYWAVQISWHVGHTEHRAHWRYHPGSHGGTAEPLDDLAEELTHPELIDRRVRLTPVATPIMAPVVNVDVVDGHEQVTVDAAAIIEQQRHRHDPAHAPFDRHGTYALDFDEGHEDERARDSAPAGQHGRHRDEGEAERAEASYADVQYVDVEFVEVEYTEIEQTEAETAEVEPTEVEPTEAETTEAESAGLKTAEVGHLGSAQGPTTPPSSDTQDARDTDKPASGTDDDEPTTTDTRPAPTPVNTPRRRKNRKPAVPAWEDVLLGVRSNPNS